MSGLVFLCQSDLQANACLLVVYTLGGAGVPCNLCTVTNSGLLVEGAHRVHNQSSLSSGCIQDPHVILLLSTKVQPRTPKQLQSAM